MCAIYVSKISMSHLIQYIQNVMSICNQYKIINEIHIHFLGCKSLNCVYFILRAEDKKTKFNGMYGDLSPSVFTTQHVFRL